MKILFASDRHPMPPRDGVTVPLSYYWEGVFQGADRDLLILRNEDESSNIGGLGPGTEMIQVVERKSEVQRMFDILFLKHPAFAAHKVPQEGVCDTDYDLIWSSPRHVSWTISEMLRMGVLQGRHHVGAVNDIATVRALSLWRGMDVTDSQYSIVEKVLGAMYWRGEHTLLRRLDGIVVQSETEYSFLRRRIKEMKPVLVIPNAVDEGLFQLEPAKAVRSFGWVGSVEGIYAQRIEWLLQEIWPKVASECPSARLLIFGKNAASLRCESRPAVKVIGYVENIVDIYRQLDAVIAPVFKGFGSINKVKEGLAAGRVVIGDTTAFNGIKDFEDGVHGIVPSEPAAFTDAMVEAYKCTAASREVAHAGRSLAEGWPTWTQNCSQVETWIEEEVREPSRAS